MPRDPDQPRHAPTALVSALRRLRSAARAVLVAHALALTLAVVALATLTVAGLDYLARFPQPLRIALFAAAAVGLTIVLRKVVWPALTFAPSLVEVALRLERSPQGRRAGLDGRLASALEFTHPPATGAIPTRDDPITSHLAGQAVAEALSRLPGVQPSSALAVSPGLKRARLLFAASLIPVAVAGLVAPDTSLLALRRVWTPWTDAAWPNRTAVADATNLEAHPLDSALSFRAVVSKTDRPPGRTPVTVEYRVQIDGTPGPITRLMLNPPRRAGEGTIPETYEATLGRDALRLAAGLTAAETDADGSTTRIIEYRFLTSDDATPFSSLILTPRPRVASAHAMITPPAYAAGVAGVASGEAAVPTENARRRPIGPVLYGSEVQLSLTLNTPVPVPDHADEQDRRAWAARELGPDTLPDDATLEISPTLWTVRWTADEPLTFRVRPTDRYGISALEESSFAVSVVRDAPPRAIVTDPATDEAVLPTALLTVAGEARDDVGLERVRLEAQRLTPPEGSAGAPPEPSGNPAVIASKPTRRENEPSEGPLGPLAAVASLLDLSTLGVAPGDEVWLTAAATDTFVLAGQRHEEVRSTPRKLKIITEAQLVDEILQQLASLRPAAQRLDQQQAQAASRAAQALRSDEPNADALAGSQREQRDIGERLAPAADAVRRALDRADRNALPDRALRDLMNDAADAVRGAREASESARDALEQAARTPEGSPIPREIQDQASRGQAQVRDQLARLDDLLSRGQDGYAARQAVERLLQDQQALSRLTREAGEAAAGREVSELPAELRTELERLARQQEELARRADSMTRDLDQRAQRVQPSDPAQAAAMQRARDISLSEQVAQQMRQAAEQTQSNQTGQAQQNQQEAQDALERMLRELDRAQARRDEELRRLLADLERSIEALIAQQLREIARLEAAIDKAEYAGLDRGMIALHANTIAVHDTSQARDVAPVRERLLSAASHQEAAAENLIDPVDALEADKNERLSLQRLREAGDLAKELKQRAEQRDEQRRRGELRKAYTEARDRQAKLRDDTAPYIDKALDRRDRNALLALAERQDEIARALRDLREKTEELAEASTFDFAHRRLDQLTGAAAGSLRAAEATAALGRDQRAAVALLTALAESLAEDDREPPFRENPGDDAGGEGGQDGGQPQDSMVPEIAELRLLRDMQREAASRTREAEAGGSPADEVRAIGRLQRDLAELAEQLAERIRQRNAPPGGGPPGGDAGGAPR